MAPVCGELAVERDESYASRWLTKSGDIARFFQIHFEFRS